jgi:hypothetical protein
MTECNIEENDNDSPSKGYQNKINGTSNYTYKKVQYGQKNVNPPTPNGFKKSNVTYLHNKAMSQMSAK